MTPSPSPLRALAANCLLRREAAALALFRLAEFGPWVAMLVFAYAQAGATTTGLVSFALLVPTALFAPFAGPLIDRFGASCVLLGAYLAQAVAMGATAASLLVDAPPVSAYVLGAVTAMALSVTHPAHAVVSPGIARTTEQLVALNAVTGWILSIGLVVAPAAAGLILAVSVPGAVYAAGAGCLFVAAVLGVRGKPTASPLFAESSYAHVVANGIRGGSFKVHPSPVAWHGMALGDVEGALECDGCFGVASRDWRC